MKEEDLQDFTYYLGADRVSALFVKTDKAQRATRTRVQINPKDIVAMAKVLAPVIDNPVPMADDDYAKMKAQETGANWRSHAFWHLGRPDRPYPCSDCPQHVRDAFTGFKQEALIEHEKKIELKQGDFNGTVGVTWGYFVSRTISVLCLPAVKELALAALQMVRSKTPSEAIAAHNRLAAAVEPFGSFRGHILDEMAKKEQKHV